MSVKLFFWGAKSKARILEQMALRKGWAIGVLYDGNLATPAFPTGAYFTSDYEAAVKAGRGCSHYAICIGGHHGQRRLEVAAMLERDMGLSPIDFIHPAAFISETVKRGAGLQAMPGSVVHEFTVLGNHCVINTNATVDHECVLGDGVHVMGAASVTGCVSIGNYASIGSNATVLPNLKIGEGALVGAGAVVTKDVPAGETVVGVPARPLESPGG